MSAIENLKRKSKTFLQDQQKLNPVALESLKEYTGFAFYQMNQILREVQCDVEAIPADKEEKQKILNIDSLFDMIDPITEPITLYRGVRLQEFTKEDFGFISTSYNIQKALSYTSFNCCLMEINVPVGTKCIFLESISNYEDEQEVLLPRNGKFVLTSVAVSTDSSEKDRYFITFIPKTSVESRSLTDIAKNGEKRIDVLETVLKTVKTSDLSAKEAHYYTNKLLFVMNSSEERESQ